MTYICFFNDIKLIEAVQRRATKLVTGMQELNYNDRLTQLRLQQLEGYTEML